MPDQQQLSLMSHVTVSKCVGHGVAGDHSLFLSNESILLSSRNNNHYVLFQPTGQEAHVSDDTMLSDRNPDE